MDAPVVVMGAARLVLKVSFVPYFVENVDPMELAVDFASAAVPA